MGEHNEIGNNEVAYRDKYIEGKFDSLQNFINSKFADIAKLIDTETGQRHSLESKVAELDKKQMQCPITHVQQSFNKFKTETELKLIGLEKTTNDLDYYKRNPKQLKLLIIGGVIFYGLSVFTTLAALVTIYNSIKGL